MPCLHRSATHKSLIVATFWHAMHAPNGAPAAAQVILKGQGKNFCGGIDFSALMSVAELMKTDCPGRAREAFRRQILRWQAGMLALPGCNPSSLL